MINARVSCSWAAIGVLVLAGCGQREPAAGKAPAQSEATTNGVNDKLVMAAALVALPPPGVTAASLPEPEAEGAKFLGEFCAGCHNLPSPTIHSATDWPSVARRMWLRMDLLPADAGIKMPTIQQRQAILNYLLTNALKVSNTTLPEGAGRATFSEICSRCHALPDPKNHSAADWPAVVIRMSERMIQMKVDRPTPAQTQEIVGYLNRVSGGVTRKAPPAPANQ